MSLEARDQALQEFGQATGCCLLLASLKCGGVGLNLTMANKVVLVDPWWNWAMEQQAFGRVFRIGQSEKTSLLRLFARNTIEERIHKMQKVKQEQIDSVISSNDSEAAPRTKRMDIVELLGLFGLKCTSEEGGHSEFILGGDSDEKMTILEDNAYRQWE
jgi:SNF2 family DNA or RNA helicase